MPGMSDRLNPNVQPDFTSVTPEELKRLKEDTNAQAVELKRAIVKDWPLHRIIVVGGLLLLGAATTVSYWTEGDIKNAAVTGALVGLLALITSTGSLITWFVDVRLVEKNRRLLDEVTPAVYLGATTFGRDDSAKLN